MKTKHYLLICIRCCLLFILLCFLSGCNNSHEEKNDLLLQGDINYKLELVEGKGKGTATSPLELSPTGTISLSIKAESNFGYGTKDVKTAQSLGSIKLFIEKSELYVKDISELKTVIGAPSIISTMSLDEPSYLSMEQNFDIGNQTIKFQLEYEIPFYSTDIIMPYVKIFLADLRHISLVPLGNDSYEVNVGFEIKLETPEVSPPKQQTLYFTVKYKGFVVT